MSSNQDDTTNEFKEVMRQNAEKKKKMEDARKKANEEVKKNYNLDKRK